MPADFSHTMCITFLAESRKTVCVSSDTRLWNVIPNLFRRASIGSGAVYSFDPVGSYERESCRAAGAAQSLVQPFLDNQVRLMIHYTPSIALFVPVLSRFVACYLTVLASFTPGSSFHGSLCSGSPSLSSQRFKENRARVWYGLLS